jgi:hypothetical protein
VLRQHANRRDKTNLGIKEEEVVLRQHANRRDKTNLSTKEKELKVVAGVTRKPSRPKKLGNGKWISAVGKEARPKRMEGKRHRNRKRTKETGTRIYKYLRSPTARTLVPVSSRAPNQVSLTPIPHPRHQTPPPPPRATSPTHAIHPPLLTSPHTSWGPLTRSVFSSVHSHQP